MRRETYHGLADVYFTELNIVGKTADSNSPFGRGGEASAVAVLKRALCVLMALCAVSASAVAQAPNITVKVDKQSVTVGDPILYTLTVQYDSTHRLIAPVVGKTLGKLEVVRDSTLSEAAAVPKGKLYRRQLQLAAFETGQLWIAPLRGETVDASGHSTPWQSDSLLLNVASVLAGAGTDTTDIHGLKEPYQVPEFRWWLWAVVAAVLLAAAALYLRRRRRRLAVLTPVAPPIPPWESALHALGSMRREIDPADDGGRLWYFRLSEILRRYFDQRFGWASIDETTTEVMRRLESAPFDGGHQERAGEFFQLADQIRYARHPAKVGRPEVDWEWVREFVQSTIPVISTPTVPEPGAASPSTGPDDSNRPRVDVTA